MCDYFLYNNNGYEVIMIAGHNSKFYSGKNMLLYIEKQKRKKSPTVYSFGSCLTLSPGATSKKRKNPSSKPSKLF